MKYIIIGNAISLVGSLIMTFMGFIKNGRRFIIAQSVMNCFYMAAFAFLGGLSGVIVNAATLIRNLVCLKFDFNKFLKAFFIVLQLALAFFLGTTGLISWLPIIAGCVFTWIMDTDDIRVLKSVIIFTQVLWLIYDIKYKNYATAPFDVASCITNAIVLVSVIKAKRVSKKIE